MISRGSNRDWAHVNIINENICATHLTRCQVPSAPLRFGRSTRKVGMAPPKRNESGKVFAAMHRPNCVNFTRNVALFVHVAATPLDWRWAVGVPCMFVSTFVTLALLGNASACRRHNCWPNIEKIICQDGAWNTLTLAYPNSIGRLRPARVHWHYRIAKDFLTICCYCCCRLFINIFAIKSIDPMRAPEHRPLRIDASSAHP